MNEKPAHLIFFALLATVIGLAGGCALPGGASPALLDYPPAHRVDVIDDYHGTIVADPFRWLEDPDAPETREWIEAENALTFSWLEEIPCREKIGRRLTELWNYEKTGIPQQRGGRYFFSRNDGLQNQSVIYWADALDSEQKVLIDPNTLSADGTVALSGYSISRDGRTMAYGLSSGGSDWTEWRVREVDTGRDLDDHLKWIKFSGASWDHDGRGFYYGRYDAPKEGQELEQANYFHKLYYHRVGTPQSMDRLVYQRPDHKEWSFRAQVSDDGRTLIISVGKGTERKNRILYRDLSDGWDPAGARDRAGGAHDVVELIGAFEARYSFIDSDGEKLLFFTDLDAPQGRVIAIDTRAPERRNWKTVIPEGAETLRSVNVVHDTFIAAYLKDARSQIKLFDMQGRFLRELELPGIGTARGFGGERADVETFYSFTSMNDPGTIFRLDMAAGEAAIFRRPDVDFDPDRYTTSQVFFESKDGTRVPMFVSHRKGLRLDGANPTILYGYGGFNIPMTPSFSVSRIVWMEMGGIYAVANIRGGGEYGRAWHEAGMKLSKQNCFDDFIAAAEWLIAAGFTRPEKLAIQGASNGGLLVGACMTQRPDLFGACLPAVGVMDMLRFNKFTIGWGWVSDYGSPEDPQEFEALHAYSPYHNLEDGTAYPATLVTTADHDDRVVPAHSFKFVARLQEAQAGSAPVLIRIGTRAGHGGGKPTTKRIEEAADRYAFLVRVLEIEAEALPE